MAAIISPQVIGASASASTMAAASTALSLPPAAGAAALPVDPPRFACRLGRAGGPAVARHPAVVAPRMADHPAAPRLVSG